MSYSNSVGKFYLEITPNITCMKIGIRCTNLSQEIPSNTSSSQEISV